MRGLGWSRRSRRDDDGIDLGPDLDLGRYGPQAGHTGTTTVLLRGRDPQTGAEVAIRCPRPDVDGGAVALQAAVTVHGTVGPHPHLVPVVAAGGAGVQAAVVTPWYSRTFAEVTGLAPVLGQAALLAATLAVLHRHGIVHGDLRREVVLLDQEGRVRLGGLHHALVPGMPTEESLQPRPVRAGGAPETVEEARPVPASDVYGLGVVLFEALAGVAPLAAVVGESQAALAARILTARRPQLAPGSAPPDVADLVHRCLSLDPFARPSAVELAQWLRQAALRETEAARAESARRATPPEDAATRRRTTRPGLVLPVRPDGQRREDEETRRRP